MGDRTSARPRLCAVFPQMRGGAHTERPDRTQGQRAAGQRPHLPVGPLRQQRGETQTVYEASAEFGGAAGDPGVAADGLPRGTVPCDDVGHLRRTQAAHCCRWWGRCPVAYHMRRFVMKF